MTETTPTPSLAEAAKEAASALYRIKPISIEHHRPADRVFAALAAHERETEAVGRVVEAARRASRLLTEWSAPGPGGLSILDEAAADTAAGPNEINATVDGLCAALAAYAALSPTPADGGGR